jgi:uncharacterized SAM-binding protein YcdF (DUF218 family)
MSHLIRQLLPVCAVAVAVVVGVGAMALRRVLSPTTTEPQTADAVVMLAGGSGERLARSLELMEAGVAPTLVLSAGNPRPPTRSRIAPICNQPQPYEVVCIAPDPDNTRGEAATVTRLAEERGWRSLAVVTSDYHLDRAAYHFGRCFDGVVHPVAAPARRRLRLVRHEVLGYVHARTLGRFCPHHDSPRDIRHDIANDETYRGQEAARPRSRR